MRRFLFGLVVAACSGDPGPQGEQGARGRTGESAVVDVRNADAAECPNGGEVITVGVGADLEEVVLCNGEDGAPGEPGEDGAKGAPGEAGPAGADAEPTTVGNPVVASQHCLAVIDELVTIDYWFDEFESGDVWASAIIYDGAFSASNSNYYGADQPGADLASVQLAFDLQGPGFGGRWVVGMSRDSLVMVITYVDSDLIAGQSTWSIPADELTCAEAEM